MTLADFLEEREPAWRELRALVGRAGRSPRRLRPRETQRLGALYREAAADLALARRRYPGDPLVGRLEDLVGRARHLVYAAPSRRVSVVSFFARDYWRLVAERPRALAVAAVLLFGPALLAGGWALDDPGAAAGLVPPEYRTVTEPRPRGGDLGLSAGEEAAFASYVFTNNIRVALFAFAGGITAGVVTALVAIYNGVLLGAVVGLAWGAGNGRSLLELVTAHGILELSCIVVAVAAGLRVGWSIVEPGYATRGESLLREARRAAALALGTAPWLVLAGLVEGFVTPAGLGLPGVATIGLGLGALFWLLVATRGRARGEPVLSL